MAELANAFVIHPRGPISNLGTDKVFSYSVCEHLKTRQVSNQMVRFNLNQNLKARLETIYAGSTCLLL